MKIDAWILENLNETVLAELLFHKINTTLQSDLQKSGAFRCDDGNCWRYYQDYVQYNRGYSCWGDTPHGNHYNHSNYSRCAYQCQVNQYVSQYIGEPNFNVADEFIQASLINSFVQYITTATNKVNELVTRDSLSDNEKITLRVYPVIALADIYTADFFNNMNANIQDFINGTTNINNKTNDDYINITDLSTFKNVLKYIKIPTGVKRESYN